MVLPPFILQGHLSSIPKSLGLAIDVIERGHLSSAAISGREARGQNQVTVLRVQLFSKNLENLFIHSRRKLFTLLKLPSHPHQTSSQTLAKASCHSSIISSPQLQSVGFALSRSSPFLPLNHLLIYLFLSLSQTGRHK